jgi:hypothetical protein
MEQISMYQQALGLGNNNQSKQLRSSACRFSSVGFSIARVVRAVHTVCVLKAWE